MRPNEEKEEDEIMDESQNEPQIGSGISQLSSREGDEAGDDTAILRRPPSAFCPDTNVNSSATHAPSTNSAYSANLDDPIVLRRKVINRIHVALMRCGGEAIRPVLCEVYRSTSTGAELDEDLVRAYGPDLSLGVILEGENYVRKVNHKDEVVYAVPEEKRKMTMTEYSMDLGKRHEEEEPSQSQESSLIPVSDEEFEGGELEDSRIAKFEEGEVEASLDVVNDGDILDEEMAQEVNKKIARTPLYDEELEEGEPGKSLIYVNNSDISHEKMAQGQNLEEDEAVEETITSYLCPVEYNAAHHALRDRYLSQLLETLRRIGKIRVPWSEAVAAHYAYFNSDLNALEEEAKLTDFDSLRAYIAEKIAIKTKKGHSPPHNRIMRLRTIWRVGMTPRREANDYWESSSDDDRSRSVDSRGRKKPKKPRTWQSPVYERETSRTPTKSSVTSLSEDEVRPLDSPQRPAFDSPDRAFLESTDRSSLSPARPIWRRRPPSKRDRPLWRGDRGDRPLWPSKEKSKREETRRMSDESSPWKKSSTRTRSSSSASTSESLLTDWAPEEMHRPERRHRSSRSSRSSRNRRNDTSRRNFSRRRASRSSSRSSSPPTRRNKRRRRRNSSSSRDEVSRSPKRRHRSRSNSRPRPFTRNIAATSHSTYPNIRRSSSRSPPPKRNLVDKISKLAAAQAIVAEMERMGPAGNMRASRSMRRRAIPKSASESGDDFTMRFARMAAGGEKKPTSTLVPKRISIILNPQPDSTNPENRIENEQKKKQNQKEEKGTPFPFFGRTSKLG